MGRPAKYPAEFRREALALVKSSGRPIAEVARSLSIAEGTLRNWVHAARDADSRAGDPAALSESERDELPWLRKEVIELQTDKDPSSGGCVFRPWDDAVIRFRFRFVHDHPGVFEVKRMCDLVEVPRSSFYAGSPAHRWHATSPTPSSL